MMFSRETFIYDAELEIVVPNDILDCNEEKVDCIIGAKQRTQIFYDELLHCYLVTTLPPESNLENKEAATEFFKNLEITLEATLINTNLAMASDYSSQLVHRVPSSSSSSSISGMFSSGRASIRSRSSSNSTSSTSPTVPGSPASDYSFKKFGKYTEGSIIYSAQYNSKSKNYDEMVVVERDGRWICVLPLSFPVAYIRTRAHGQITLSVNVAQPQRYSVETFENFGMNLLGGLSDDPAFESLNAVCSIPTSRFTRQDPIKKTTALTSTHKTLSVKPMLNVRIKVTNVSNTLMMSVELENDTDHDISLSIEDVKIEVAHAFVTRYGWSLEASNDKFPILLRPVDQVTLLYNVTILEDSSFPKALNTQQHCPTPIPHSEASSRRGSIASIASINPILNTLPVENKHRILSIIVKACPVIDGIKSRYIESKRNCMLDISTLLSNPTTAAHNPFNLNNIKNYNSYGASGVGLGINSNKNDVDGNNGILPSGRLPKLQKQVNSDVCDGGVSVSFMVCGKPVVGRVFTIKVFMVNNSKQVRKFTIMIPNKKRPDERSLQSQLSPSTLLSQTTDITLVESSNSNIENVKSLRNPFMDETEFLRKQLEFEATDANLICLDDNVKVCSIEPYKSQSATLHFVSIKEALQVVELVQLVDNDTGFVTNLRNVVQVDVKRSARNQRRIDHDSVVLRHIEVTG